MYKALIRIYFLWFLEDPEIENWIEGVRVWKGYERGIFLNMMK